MIPYEEKSNASFNKIIISCVLAAYQHALAVKELSQSPVGHVVVRLPLRTRTRYTYVRIEHVVASLNLVESIKMLLIVFRFYLLLNWYRSNAEIVMCTYMSTYIHNMHTIATILSSN